MVRTDKPGDVTAPCSVFAAVEFELARMVASACDQLYCAGPTLRQEERFLQRNIPQFLRARSLQFFGRA